MRLDITWRNIDPSETITERAERKLSKVAKHLREPMEAHMVVRHEKRRYDVELTITAPGFQTAVRSSTDDFIASVDGVMNRMERTARRHRERVLHREHQAPAEAQRY